MGGVERRLGPECRGWCTPCWEGLSWTEQILEGLEGGRGRAEDLDLLGMHTRLIGPGRTFCALAPGAMDPLQSALKYFRADFERHIHEHRCPWSEKDATIGARG